MLTIYLLICLVIALNYYGSVLITRIDEWKSPFTFYCLFFLACPFVNILTFVYLALPTKYRDRFIEYMKSN